MKLLILKNKRLSLTSEQWFMLSMIAVNGGNYLYNLIVGRLLGPERFADASVLIGMLMLLSFVSMTFQLTTAKYKGLLEGGLLKEFKNSIINLASFVGILFGIVMFLNAHVLQEWLQTSNSTMFEIFAVGIPLYFMMSLKRGLHQGGKDYTSLSKSYHAEMISRLLITVIVLYLIPSSWANVVAIGLLGSMFFAFVPFQLNMLHTIRSWSFKIKLKTEVIGFLMITAAYEMSQILINNGDIFMVKHFYTDMESGLYSSMALIGRVVFFIAWMLAIMLLPEVVERKKNNQATFSILMKYLGMITGLVVMIVLACLIAPKLIIGLLFGEAFEPISPLLWKYALASGLFAISNLFVYYFLSLSRYIPVAISIVMGVVQLTAIYLFHSGLEAVVNIQITVMGALLGFQLIYYFIYHFTPKNHLSI